MLAAIKMPKLSNFDEYEIVEFYHKVGDKVNRGDIFLDAKIEGGETRNVCFYLSGTITEINVSKGSVVREDSLLGVIDDEK